MSALSLLSKAEASLARGQSAVAHARLLRARRAKADPFLKAEILHKDADALRALGRFRESLSCYRQAHVLYQNLQISSESLSALLGASACLRILGRYTDARRLWGGLRTRKGFRASFAEIEMERALVARGQGRFSETRQRISRALRFLRKFKSPSRQLELQHAYWISGGLERFSGYFSNALHAYKEAVRLARQSRDASAEAFALCGLAGVERVVGQERASLAHYLSAQATFRKTGDPFGVAYGLCGQANALRTFGDPTKTLALYRRSAGLYHRLGDESSEAFAYWGLGGSFRRLRRFPRALVSYRRALRLFKKSKDERGIVMAHLGLARLAEDRGSSRTALLEAVQGLGVARQAKLRYETALARYEIGRIKRPFRPPTRLLGALGIVPPVLKRWRDIP